MRNARILVFAALVLVLTAGAASAQNAIAVNGTAAIDGSFGLEMSYGASQNNDAYVAHQQSPALTNYTIEFKVDCHPLGLTNVANNKKVIISKTLKEAAGQRQGQYIYCARNNAGTRNRIIVGLRNDAGTFSFFAFAAASDGAATQSDTIRIEYEASTGGGANGSLRVFRDGVIRVNQSGLSGYDTRDLSEIRFGNSNETVRAGVNGSAYFDSFSLSQ